MKHINTALILYPHQLFDPSLLPEADVIILVEDPLFFGTDPERQLNLHKQKLVLLRASMRRYIEEVLWQQDLNVEYVELKDIKESGEILTKAQKAGAELVMLFEPTDHLLESRLKRAMDEEIKEGLELRVLPSPSFMLKKGEVKDFFANQKKNDFASFYQWQRERFNILIDKNYHPVGEKWMFKSNERMVLPDTTVSPGFKAFGDNDYVKQAKSWVAKNFAGNVGLVDDFFWPTSHSEAEQWLKDFLQNRLKCFAAYADTIDNNSVLLYHSGVSVMLNIGLLTPIQIIQETLKYHTKRPVDMVDLEGFIRRIIGWREYIRGMYAIHAIQQPKIKDDEFGKSLSLKWWNGTTGVPPLDDCVHKLIAHGYVSFSERQMVLSNLMLLTQIHPSEAYRWFSSMFIDMYDWMVVPSVNALYQLADFNGMNDKYYITDSSYILQNSDYPKDLWCDIWDGLFWAYIEKHHTALANNPSMAGLLKKLPKISAEQRRIIGYRAQDFLASLN